MYDPGTHEPETLGLIANMIYVAMVVVGYGIAAVFSPQTGRFLRIECLRYRNSNRILSLRAHPPCPNPQRAQWQHAAPIQNPF